MCHNASILTTTVCCLDVNTYIFTAGCIHNLTSNIVAKFFLYENAGDKLKRLVERGKAAVNAGNPVVAQCAYGKHRSRAVLELIGDSFHSSRIYYVHRECM